MKKCAVCEIKPVDPRFKPFCSKRCADVDLSRWLKGSYAIPGRPADQADDVPSAPDPSDA
ncbi:MAG: DNA gyrase inhibitor YacG [Henriciella sp.]|nr:DNA gyrase inhibitor YacG [Henriciella sp.]